MLIIFGRRRLEMADLAMMHANKHIIGQELHGNTDAIYSFRFLQSCRK